ncbi:ComEA family DNA-binding protein [Christiangramia crocea]|uniref:Helix-hairpin-helix domain-containing protein n=1 Tax=Christiangramia crocea TaxID=2904124 RepID=A0A9X2A673_9FLAO|nr:helix-hairpin-helix domain-containing protein [Gramella crocea]MCG9970741.1 helix-hairpin-helix domain-containing protein [Gramella crocea]
MKFLRSHFALSKSQQNGIFILVIFIIVFQGILLFDFYTGNGPETVPAAKIEAYQRQLDSLNRSQPGNKDTLYPFNPNFITDFKGYQLGMSVEEIDRLMFYRGADKWINSAVDFQRVTGISDSLLQAISPSFRFPEWTQRSVPVISTGVPKTPVNTPDLNAATAEDLVVVNGIGEVLSKRIVKYRNSIGGFRAPIQLNDVYGLSPQVVENILMKFQLISVPDTELKDINLITAGELAEMPYFNYDLAQKVVTYRRLHENISSFEELSKIDGFPSDKIDRIKLYLAIK